MEESPFPHHGPLPPELVTGRDIEVQELALKLRQRRPVALLGPRRYGKTSLVRHCLAQLDEIEATSVVWIDLYGLTSFSDFAVRLDRALTGVRGPYREALDSLAAGVSIRLGVIGVELRRAAPSGPDPVATIHQLLDVLVDASARHRVVVVFDEFSDVGRVDGLAAILRTHLQHHYRDLGPVFAGSRPSMMRTMFTDRGEPFFAQADLMELGPLSQQAVTDIVYTGFNSTDRGAGPVPSRVVAVGEGHPQRSMMLADAAWLRTPEGHDATDTSWAQAFGDVRAAAAGPLAMFYEELPAAQGPVLRAVAQAGSPFAAAESRFHDLSRSSITAARDALIRDGHLARSADGKVHIIDPLLRDWLRETFP